MSYHNEMMNIQSAVEDYDYMGCQVYSYNEGHLDARHAAAEIASKADKEIAELEEMIDILHSTLESSEEHADHLKNILDGMNQ